MMWLLMTLFMLITTPAFATTTIHKYIQDCAPDVPEKEVRQICTAVNKYAKHYSVPASLIVSVIAVESNFNYKVAGGLMQVRPHIWMPELKKNNVIKTWRELKTINGNVKAGTYILKHYKLNVKKYNGGGDKHYTKKVRKHGRKLSKCK